MKQKRIVNLSLIKKINKRTCIICKSPNPDAHHVKSKKSGGDDIESNLMPLCRAAHQEVHKIGLSRFSDRHESVKHWLIGNEWEFSTLLMRWIRPKGGGYIP
jgi:hypothetical protein